jgi:hypothetical protein
MCTCALQLSALRVLTDSAGPRYIVPTDRMNSRDALQDLTAPRVPSVDVHTSPVAVAAAGISQGGRVSGPPPGSISRKTVSESPPSGPPKRAHAAVIVDSDDSDEEAFATTHASIKRTEDVRR